MMNAAGGEVILDFALKEGKLCSALTALKKSATPHFCAATVGRTSVSPRHSSGASPNSKLKSVRCRKKMKR